jgi:ABC-type transport system involved in cytochrome c biogenesis permease component
MSGFGRLLQKDLRLLLRSRGLIALLVGYPILVATLVAVALQGGERRPAIGFVNLDTSNRTVKVGENRLGIEDYRVRLAREVDLLTFSPPEARRALADGRVSAVLTLPEGFIRDLQSGIRTPEVTVQSSTRSPIEAQSITRRLESSVYRFNQELSETYVNQTLELVRIVIEGGDIAVLSRSGTVLGLRNSETLVRSLQATLIAQGQRVIATRMDPLLHFVIEAGRNLDLANDAANAIRNPIKLTVTAAPVGREPLSSFGFAGALLVSLALLGVLLGAAGLAAEREENTLGRLRRGLVSLETLVGEKVTLAAIVSAAIGAVLLVAVALTTDLALGRWALWVPALLISGLAFGAFGALIGALARETRTALLAALMVALPLIFLGLFTQSPAATAISEPFAFGPAFRVFQSLIVEPSVDAGEVWARLGQLGLIAAVLAGAGALILRRRVET